MMETKGLKMLKNVKTHWIFLLDPLRRVLEEYMRLLAKMVMDNLSNQVAKVPCFNLFLNVYWFELCILWFLIFFKFVDTQN
jgi:hypothetical protein